jgi:hypothetical protein
MLVNTFVEDLLRTHMSVICHTAKDAAGLMKICRVTSEYDPKTSRKQSGSSDGEYNLYYNIHEGWRGEEAPPNLEPG